VRTIEPTPDLNGAGHGDDYPRETGPSARPRIT
jgi:hypothetical protein